MTQAATLDQRVMAAITAYFAQHGHSPSYRDIGLVVGMEARHVGRHLRRLAALELLSFTAGQRRSIVLADRTAGLSDVELERAVRLRGGRIEWSAAPGLAAAFAPGVAIMGITPPDDMAHLLDEID